MFNLVKGTHDILIDEADKYSYVEQTLIQIAETFNFKEFRTPIIEHSELFIRSVGDSSDIVRKEMYIFEDKSGRSITLRPEITAGIARSIVNNKLLAMQDYPVKAFYVGPCFRYERPQQGRYRQFNQFGIECVGVNSPYRDVEIISFGYYALKMLGFDKVNLKINTLGDEESRTNYKNALREYFSDKLDSLCADCKERFNLNVLRILDCKVDEDSEILKNAPRIQDYLTDNAKEKFQKVIKELDNLGIPYEIDNNLVRGLDYYSDCVFEYHYTTKNGVSLGALGAGGHYNKLITEVGGPKDCEGVGLAFGVERLVTVMSDENLFEGKIDNQIDVYVMPIGDYQDKALEICNTLRLNGFLCDVCLENKSVSQMFKKALRRNAKFALILGEDEVKNNTVKFKNLKTEVQDEIEIDNIVCYLDGFEYDEDEHEHCHHE